MNTQEREIMQQALARIAMNTHGDTPPQVIAGDAIHACCLAALAAGVEPTLQLAAPQQQDSNVWSSYVAGMVECYLQSEPPADKREAAIAGIISRRFWALGGRAAGVEPAVPSGISLDLKQVSELLEMFGGEPTEITLMYGDGHSGKGVYAHYTDMPEEGAEYFGISDDEAIPAPQPAAQPENKRPQNCGTSFCSCIECPYEPAAQPAPDAALLARIEAYEKHGVTCQTFGGFVDAPCAECNAAQPAERKPLNADHVRAAGGIVHGDGNIFFTNIEQLNAAVAQAVKPSVEKPLICANCWSSSVEHGVYNSYPCNFCSKPIAQAVQ